MGASRNCIVYLICLTLRRSEKHLNSRSSLMVLCFDNYKKFQMESVRKLTTENERLQSLITEFKLEGMEVTVTMYHPVSSQTDSTPNILADGTRIKVREASNYKFIAVSRNLLRRWGGFLDYGDWILLRGTDHKDGVYQVRDTMNKRWVNRIDILESEDVDQYMFPQAEIIKLAWTTTE